MFPLLETRHFIIFINPVQQQTLIHSESIFELYAPHAMLFVLLPIFEHRKWNPCLLSNPYVLANHKIRSEFSKPSAATHLCYPFEKIFLAFWVPASSCWRLSERHQYSSFPMHSKRALVLWDMTFLESSPLHHSSSEVVSQTAPLWGGSISQILAPRLVPSSHPHLPVAAGKKPWQLASNKPCLRNHEPKNTWTRLNWIIFIFHPLFLGQLISSIYI